LQAVLKNYINARTAALAALPAGSLAPQFEAQIQRLIEQSRHKIGGEITRAQAIEDLLVTMPWFVDMQGWTYYVEHPTSFSAMFESGQAYISPMAAFNPFMARIVDLAKTGTTLEMVDANAVSMYGDLRLLERAAAAWGVSDLLGVAFKAGMLDAYAVKHGTTLKALEQAIRGTHQAMRELVERLVLGQSMLLDDTQFVSVASKTIKTRKDGLLDVLIEAVLGNKKPLANFLGTTASGAASITRWEYLLNRDLNAAEVNRIINVIKEIPKSQRTRGAHESTIWAPTPQQSMYYLERMRGMVHRAQALMLNPDYVGAELETSGTPSTRPMDAYSVRYRPGTTIVEDLVVKQAKSFSRETLSRSHADVADSLWDDMRTGVFSTAALSEAWVGLAMEEDSAANAALIHEIENTFNWLNEKDPRFRGKVQRLYEPGDFLTWKAAGLEFPFKLDSYRQALFRGYVQAELAKHDAAGDLGTYTVTRMMADIIAAHHADLSISKDCATLFLVQNRDASGKALRDGIDPLNVKGEYELVWNPVKKRWDVKIDQAGQKVVRPAWDALGQWIARPDDGMTLQQFRTQMDALPGKINALEGFFIDTRDVTMRAALTRKSRGQIMRENIRLIDVLCEIAGIKNELRKKVGWWTAYIPTDEEE